MLGEYNEMKEEIKNPENAVEYTMKKQWKHFVIYKANTAKKSSSVRRTKQNTLELVSNCAIGGNKKSMFIKNQEASGSRDQNSIKKYSINQ